MRRKSLPLSWATPLDRRVSEICQHAQQIYSLCKPIAMEEGADDPMSLLLYVFRW